MRLRTYAGSLTFDLDGVAIEVERFIVRKDSVAFAFKYGWARNDTNRYVADATASLSNGIFKSAPLNTKTLVGEVAAESTVFEFRLAEVDDQLSVEGTLYEAGESYEFRGHLDIWQAD